MSNFQHSRPGDLAAGDVMYRDGVCWLVEWTSEDEPGERSVRATCIEGSVGLEAVWIFDSTDSIAVIV